MGFLQDEIRIEGINLFNIDKYKHLATTNISDALDFFGMKGAVGGINKLWPGAKKIFGPAITIKIIASGSFKSKTHLGVEAITVSKKGDVIVIDSSGRTDSSCWGGILATAASLKGIEGVVADGACRDIDEYIELDFPVYALNPVVLTARGRTTEYSTNEMIQVKDIQVSPGDLVVADLSGVVFVPVEKIQVVLEKAEELYKKESEMIRALQSGESLKDVDKEFNYEKMLKSSKS